MILIEVIKLIVDINWSLNLAVNGQLDLTVCRSSCCITKIIINISALVVVLLDSTLDALAHHVEGDSEREEDQSKDSEDDHCGTERWYRSPSREHLLLEFALLELADLLLNLLKFFLVVGHGRACNC